MTRASLQLVAAFMATTNAVAWVLASRWERPGRSAELRAKVSHSSLVDGGGDLVQVVPFCYPAVALIAPGWANDGSSTWSTDFDFSLQMLGLGLWGAGIAMAIWAARSIGAYGAFSGVALDHQLVSDGPYRYIRHPVYTSLIAVAVGTTLVFRSYLLLGIAALSIFAHLRWAAGEEKLLASTQGLGDAYRTYASRTGRFLPRFKPEGQRADPP